MIEDKIIGQGWHFPLKPSVQGGLFKLTHAGNEIEQAIHIILGTAPGERVMRPEFGCRIHELTFAPNDRETAVHATRYVQEALRRWEPRIHVDDVTAQPAGADNSRLLVTVTYTVKVTGDPRSLVYPFYLIPDEGSPDPIDPAEIDALFLPEETMTQG